MTVSYFTNLQHPKEQSLITRIALALYKAEKELKGETHWTYIRTDDPLANLEYQSTILETIGTELQSVDDDIACLEDEDTRSALTLWHSLVFKLFSDMYKEYSKVAGGLVD